MRVFLYAAAFCIWVIVVITVITPALLIFSPAMLEESEVSVYDLKDHPDFQYRPGTVVIRVANFEGEDANSTAGQVLDNYPEGLVRVLFMVLNDWL
jgi:hypothetical protein